MADGTVTIKVDLDGKGAQSGVSKLKDMLGGLGNKTSKVGSVFKSVLGANLIGNALSKGISMVTSNLDGAIQRFDTLNKYPTVMKSLGYSAQDVAKSTKILSDGIDGLPTTLDGITAISQQLAPLTGNATKASKSAIALNNAFLASGAGAEGAQRGLQQYTQMLSTGKVDMMSWRTLQETMPVALRKTAEAFGFTGKAATNDLYEALKSGSITMDELNDKFIELNEGQNGFAELARKNSAGIGTSFSNLRNAVAKNLANMISDIDEAFEKKGLGSIAQQIDGIKNYVNSAFETMSPYIVSFAGTVIDTIQGAITSLQEFWAAFKDTGALSALGEAAQSVAGAFGHIKESLTGDGFMETLGTVLGNLVDWLSQAVTAVADFISGLDPSVIQMAASAVFSVVIALGALKKGLAIAEGLKKAFDFGKTLVNLVSNILGLTGAQAANAGASAAMSAGNTAVGTTAGASAGAVMKLGAAVLMIGAGVLMAAAGVYVLVQAAMQLASAGTGAQVAMLAIVAGIALLAAGAAAIGPALSAGAIGLLAFGAAVLMIGAGIGLATAGLALLATQLPTISTYGASAALAFAQLGAGLLAIGAGALVAGAGLTIAGAGLAIVGAGALVAAAGALALGAGLLVAAAGVAAFGLALRLAKPGLNAFANAISKVIDSLSGGIVAILKAVKGVITSIGNAALKAGQGFKLLAQGVVMITNTKLSDMAASLAAVAKGVTKIAAQSGGLASAGTGMKSLGQGMLMIQMSGTTAATALTSLTAIFPSLASKITAIVPAMTTTGTAMKTFATSAVSTFTGLTGATASITALQAKIVALATAIVTAQSGFSKMSASFAAVVVAITALNVAIGTVSSSFPRLAMTATATMAAFNSAIKSAMSKSVSATRSGMQKIVSVVRSSATQMTQAGKQAGQGTANGVANGINAGIKTATAAMTKLVEAIRTVGANSANTMHNIGLRIGQGLASGMYSALGAVTAAADALVAEAERAAQAKAQIHSPSRLFRDNVGRYIAEGIAVGIKDNANSVVDSLAYVQREMSAFKFAAEDLLGLGNSSITRELQLKAKVANAKAVNVSIEKEKADRNTQMLIEAIESLADRPVAAYLDGDKLVSGVGSRVTAYQERETKIANRLKGVL
ncbi:tape measure protein [Streptococcus sp. H49]|uniref:tape measure protein n=1 Tax=Streptococcus huangxiaojuni TaxID=3237239 RepID=UPI0034A20856